MRKTSVNNMILLIYVIILFNCGDNNKIDNMHSSVFLFIKTNSMSIYPLNNIHSKEQNPLVVNEGLLPSRFDDKPKFISHPLIFEKNFCIINVFQSNHFLSDVP